MIVETMNSGEIIAEILKDNINVERKINHFAREVRKNAIRQRNKNYSRLFEYKSPLKNNWLISIDYNSGELIKLLAVYYFKFNKLNAIIAQPNRNSFVNLTSHFLKRYNERFIKMEDLSTFNILKLFLVKNDFGTIDMFDDEESGEKRVLAKFQDGIGFGVYEETAEQKLAYLRTYITSEMIGKWQQAQFDSISKDYQRLWEEVIRRDFD